MNKAKSIATPAQIKAIHAILNKHGLLDHKAEYVSAITNGRTESTKDLTRREVREFFSIFEDDSQTEARRNAIYTAIWKIAWNMGIIYGISKEDYEMNKAKLNTFCKERGTVKKNITQMNLAELNKTRRQFEAMYRRFKESKEYVVQS